MSFNCRGVGNAAIVSELHDLVQRFALDVLYILETQIDRKCSETLHRSSGYDNAYGVSSNNGRSGGMCVYWNNSLNMNVTKISSYNIDMTILR
jgi:exonuclease III